MTVEYKDLGWQQIVKTLTHLGSVRLKIGVVGSRAQEPHGDGRLTNAEAMAINELGTDDGHVPARPALKKTFTRDRNRLQRLMAADVRAIVMGGKRVIPQLQDLGDLLIKLVRETIERPSGMHPNAQSTVRRKDTAQPLVDHHQLARAISYEIEASPGSGPSGEDEQEIAGVVGYHEGDE